MLSRMYSTTLVVRSVRAAGARRFMATKPPPSTPTPPKAQATAPPPKAQATAPPPKAAATPPPKTATAPPSKAAPAESTKGAPAGATQAKTTPPDSTSSQKPSSNAPQSLNTATLNSISSRSANAHFAKARVNLPLRFYNKQGVLASRLYVEAEKGGKAEVDKVASGLTSLRNELTAHPKLLGFLVNAAKTPQQKSSLFNSLSTSLKLPPTLSRFLDYMSKTRTSQEMMKVIQNYDSLIQARDKTVDVTITLASENQPKPDSKEIARVLKYKEDTNIKLNVVVDPSIEGGAILSSKDRYLDRSFRKATSAFRQKLALDAARTRSQKRTEFMKELAQFPDSVHP